MQKPIVGFDMDGTLINYNERLHEEIQQSKNIPQEIKNTLLDINNRKDIDLSNCINYSATDLTQQEVRDMINSIRQTKNFFKSLSFRPGVIQTLKELNKTLDIHIVSKPSEAHFGSEGIKADSIVRAFSNDLRKKLTLTFDKTLRGGDGLVDDDPYIGDNKSKKTPRSHILMDQPHNQNIDKPRLFLDRQDEWESIIMNVLNKKKI